MSTVQAMLQDIVEDLEREHGGGEPYFDALDSILRTPFWYREVLFRYLEEFPDLPRIALSGTWGRGFATWFRQSDFARYLPKAICLPGGLRKNRLSELGVDLQGQVFTFLDDSLYRARTRDEVRRVIEGAGGHVFGTLVIYDGSRELLTSVKSLYRYHR